MRESIHNYMDVGLVHFMSYPSVIGGEGPILETIKKVLTDDYFDAIELTWIKDDKTRLAAKAMLEQSFIKVCYGAQPRLLLTKLNPNDLNEAGRLQAEATLLEAIDEAKTLCANGIAFLAGKWDEENKEAHYSKLIKTTRNLCAYAKQKNMNVELEVFDFDLDKKSLIGPAPLALRFAQEMRTYTNNFGLLVDLSHLPQTYEDSRFALSLLKPYITHLHIGNAVIKEGAEAFGDTHPRFGFANSAIGVIEVAEFFQICMDEGLFRKEKPLVMSFEVKPWKDEDPDIIIANAKRVINRAWAQVNCSRNMD